VSCHELFAKIPSLPIVLELARIFQALPKIHDRRWGSEPSP